MDLAEPYDRKPSASKLDEISQSFIDKLKSPDSDSDDEVTEHQEVKELFEKDLPVSEIEDWPSMALSRFTSHTQSQNFN